MATPLTDFLEGLIDHRTPSVTREAGHRLCSKLLVFHELAASLAALSTCRRAQVGAVVVPPELSEVLAIGYNGPARGRPNDSCRGGEGACGCCHSEANAIAKLGSGRSDLVLVSTTSPCEHCAGLVANCLRVSHVVYDKPYRDPTGLGVLRDAGIVAVDWWLIKKWQMENPGC